MDHLYNPGDRHFGGFPVFRLQRRSGPTGRAWATVPNCRQPGQHHDPGCPQRYERFTRCFSCEEESTYKGDKVWYDRCNFSKGLVHCVLINYPAREERAWDDIVTRISLSLSGK
jgi:hypothetical protein